MFNFNRKEMDFNKFVQQIQEDAQRSKLTEQVFSF